MESMYWVISWACHRRCEHCYDDRFRPYKKDELKQIVGEGQQAYKKIVENLPDDFSYLDPNMLDENGQPTKRRGRIVIAGGEVLIDSVREPLFYPILDALNDKYGKNGPRLAVQTTGDILTEKFLEEMLERNVWSIAISSIDDYHKGLEGDKKFRLMDKVRNMMAKYGVEETSLGGAQDPRIQSPEERDYLDEDGPFFVFFGAQPELWIGELWPRGRSWTNGLSKANYDTNFCARWAGGKNFLNYGYAGSEVAIEPDGAVYPCCMKTKAALGYLTEEPLTDILDSLKGHPAIEAINRGDPEGMGLDNGWSREIFRQRSHLIDPKGHDYGNMCLGCDAYFAKHLGDSLKDIRRQRLSKKGILIS
ncbi:radical SAM/SPASM domain-containing protein [Alteromonadaceae bacterium M269]|nr:radical SAM/SPASM domain-containing protein [Alteromonadaceae bacterium M269]